MSHLRDPANSPRHGSESGVLSQISNLDLRGENLDSGSSIPAVSQRAPSLIVVVLVKNVVDEFFDIVFAPVRANPGPKNFTDFLTSILTVLPIP